MCAVYNRPWDSTSEPPTLDDIESCRKTDGCLAKKMRVMNLPGAHTFHIGMVDFERAQEIGVFRTTHVWCVHLSACETGYCTMPASMEGLKKNLENKIFG